MRVVLAAIERFSFTEQVLLGCGDVVDGLYLLQDDKCSRDAMLSNPDGIIAISADLMFEFVLVQWTRKSLRTIDGLKHAFAQRVTLCEDHTVPIFWQAYLDRVPILLFLDSQASCRLLLVVSAILTIWRVVSLYF